MKTNIFRDCLKEGAVGEDAVKESLSSILFTESARAIKYGKNIFSTNLQRKGVDGLIEIKEVKYETKMRGYQYHRYKDLLIEEISVVENKKPGWFYYSIADFVVYVWKNSAGTAILDGYFIFIQNPVLRNWYEENKEKYQTKTAESRDNGITWHTLNRAIPIKDFPENTILNFKPNISLDKWQSKLLNFLDYDLLDGKPQTTQQKLMEAINGK